MDGVFSITVLAKKDFKGAQKIIAQRGWAPVHIRSSGGKTNHTIKIMMDANGITFKSETGMRVVSDSYLIQLISDNLAWDHITLVSTNNPQLITHITCTTCWTTPHKLLTCSQCMACQYCNVTCQQSHWKTHKAECIAPIKHSG